MSKFNIRRRLRAFIAKPKPEIRPTEWWKQHLEDISEAEEVGQSLVQYLTTEEMFEELADEAQTIAERMSGWVAPDEMLDEVLEYLPESKDDLKDHNVAVEAVKQIQQQFVIPLFFREFSSRAYSFRNNIANLEQEAYFIHLLQVSVLTTQIVHIMVVSTQALITNAYARKNELEEAEAKSKETEENTSPTSSGWMAWGMVGDA